MALVCIHHESYKNYVKLQGNAPELPVTREDKITQSTLAPQYFFEVDLKPKALGTTKSRVEFTVALPHVRNAPLTAISGFFRVRSENKAADKVFIKDRHKRLLP